MAIHSSQATHLINFSAVSLVKILLWKIHRCPVCGASLSDISDTGKVGCADCYKTFLNQLMPSIQRMHGNTHHIGKIPMGTALQVVEQTEEKEPPKEKSEIEQYQEQLQTAIDEQNFELAAELRDKIKALSEKLE